MTLGEDSVDHSIEVIPSGSLGLDLALGVVVIQKEELSKSMDLNLQVKQP